MAIETEKSSISINKIIVNKNEKIEIEGECIVPDVKPDILEVISSSGVVSIYKKELTEGRIRIEGCINTYIMYSTNDEKGNKVRSIVHNLDFSQIISVPNVNSDMIDNSSLELDSINCKIINERKINIKANLRAELKIFQKMDTDFITGVNINDVQKLEDNLEINALIGIGNTKSSVKENINIDETEELAEILKISTDIISREIKVSLNKVLIKSDLKLKIVYSTVDGKIKTNNSLYSFVGFVDIQNINDNNIFDINYEIKNIIINSNGTKDHSIYFETEIGINVMAYNTVNINVIKDLYSPSINITFEKKRINVMQNKRNTNTTYNISQSNILNIGDSILYDVESYIEIENTICKKDEVEIIGNLNCKVIYRSNNEIKKENIMIPIHHNIPMQYVDDNTKINVKYNLINENYTIMPGGNVCVKLDVCFELSSENEEYIELIEKVEEGESVKNNNYNMVIYYTKEGDSLWEIAKRFGSTTSDIIKDNELKDNDIKVGTELFIIKKAPAFKVV